MAILKEIKTKFLYFFRGFVFRNYQKSILFRKLYWDQRAADIQKKYNTHQNDFHFLKQLIDEIKPQHLLEIGCGSGRLLPVYLAFPFIKGINLQDISVKALGMIDSTDKRIRRISDSILVLDKKLPRQDLIISNRVLQHIPRNQIEKHIEKICLLSDVVYINELSLTDGIEANNYMNVHDYAAIFLHAGFEISKTGLIDKQTIFVFKKRMNDTI